MLPGVHQHATSDCGLTQHCENATPTVQTVKQPGQHPFGNVEVGRSCNGIDAAPPVRIGVCGQVVTAEHTLSPASDPGRIADDENRLRQHR